jgi:mono/diheme cytochrome c family protein
MRKFIISFAVLALLGGGTFVGVKVYPVAKPVDAIELTGNVAAGAYLARAAGCIACHTNVEGGGLPLAGGTGFETPFGTVFAANLTTDPEFGIGNWKIEDFAKAVRQGLSPEDVPYYPVFTYAFYQDFTDQQIADLWAAFQTVPAVAEAPPATSLGFPFSQRDGLKLWRAAFLYPPRTAPVDSQSDVWNRGRELVEGATHCAACHTERNIAGGRMVKSGRMAGNDTLPGGSKAPAITSAALITAGWNVDSLTYALETGLTPTGDAFGGSMGEVVQMGTKFLTPDDRTAMAIYLMDQTDE